MLRSEAGKQFDEERRAWRERNAAKLAAGGGGSMGETLDEEDRAITKGRELQQKSRESLANSIKMASEATHVGQDTLMKLTAQKEQMKKMDDDLDKTNESLNRSERVIRGMKSTIGGIRNFFSNPAQHHSQKLDPKSIKVESFKDAPRTEEGEEGEGHHEKTKGGTPGYPDDEEDEEEAKRKVPLKDRDLSRESDKSRGFLQEVQKNQEVEDTQLDELGDLLGQLKGQAKDMNNELKVQEKLVDHLGVQVDKTGARVKAADHNVKQIH